MTINEMNELLMKYADNFKVAEKTLFVCLVITLVAIVFLCFLEEHRRTLQDSSIPIVFAIMLLLSGPVAILTANYFVPIPEGAPSRDFLVEKCEFEYQGRIVKNQWFVSGLESFE